jgi:hypothetical protein
MIMLNEEQQTAMHRQRRFLILMSLAVVAFYVLGLKVKPDAGFQGFLLSVKFPERAIYGLWAIWGWSLWRYLQRGYELFSEIRNEMREDVYSEDRRIAVNLARKHGNSLAAKGLLDMPRSARIRGGVNLAPHDGMGGQGPDYIPNAGGRNYDGITATFKWNKNNESGAAQKGFTMNMTRMQVLRLQSWAWIQAFFRLPAFSDYIAPLLIAACAPITWALSRC